MALVEINPPLRCGNRGGFEVDGSVLLYKDEVTSQEILVNSTFDSILRVSPQKLTYRSGRISDLHIYQRFIH